MVLVALVTWSLSCLGFQVRCQLVGASSFRRCYSLELDDVSGLEEVAQDTCTPRGIQGPNQGEGSRSCAGFDSSAASSMT